jgi:glycerol-3-phosphate dehydrogenase
MDRDRMLERISEVSKVWDFVIIGGGATGVGVAIEAASRGYETLLIDQNDFGKGTSSRSTKLIHGGVRYLQQGNVALVLEALRERGLLLENAPHLVHKLAFIVPNYHWWEAPFYGIGLKTYDLLSGKYSFGKSRILSKTAAVEHCPTMRTKGLKSGVIYYDGQFDDSRLLVNMAQTAEEQGGTLINYFKTIAITKLSGTVNGVRACDLETGKEYDIKAKLVINAAGVFADNIRQMDGVNEKPMISPSQGIHIVLDKSFLPGKTAIMVPRTDDGRVLFVIPWQDHLVVGTTDTPVTEKSLEPVALESEIEFLIEHTGRYLSRQPTEKDVLSVFAGLRPLVSSPDEKNTKAISREHAVHVSKTGLLTITGGKWTTYRKMAEDAIDKAVGIGELPKKPCITKQLKIHGCCNSANLKNGFELYGSDGNELLKMAQEDASFNEIIHPKMKTRVVEIIWAVRHEMARTVEDFLARRNRALFLDARAAIEMTPKVAEIMARELNQNRDWQNRQIAQFEKVARGYLI